MGSRDSWARGTTDPEELQEVGLFLLLGMVWAMLMGQASGEYRLLVNVVIGTLFTAGIIILGYGFYLYRREGKLIPDHERHRDRAKEG